jgi:hypothetical protein
MRLGAAREPHLIPRMSIAAHPIQPKDSHSLLSKDKVKQRKFLSCAQHHSQGDLTVMIIDSVVEKLKRQVRLRGKR